MENLKKEFVIIRSYSAGCHMGYLAKKSNGEGCYHVTLENSRRIWSWSGANSLSELAHSGSKKPASCNISLPVHKIDLCAIEVIYVSEEGKKNLERIKDWKFSS